jgi:hypothetical protein
MLAAFNSALAESSLCSIGPGARCREHPAQGQRAGAFKGARMPVAVVFENAEDGKTIHEMMEQLPSRRSTSTACSSPTPQLDPSARRKKRASGDEPAREDVEEVTAARPNRAHLQRIQLMAATMR